MSRNAVKQSTEPITISNIKTFKNSHGISVIPNTKQEKIEIRKNISPIENDHRSKIKEISLKDNQEKEVLGKINKDLEENSSKKLENCTNSYANKLFEHFIIIGADPNDLEQTNENNLKNATINPKILYDFDCDKCKVEKKDEKYIFYKNTL